MRLLFFLPCSAHKPNTSFEAVPQDFPNPNFMKKEKILKKLSCSTRTGLLKLINMRLEGQQRWENVCLILQRVVGRESKECCWQGDGASREKAEKTGAILWGRRP